MAELHSCPADLSGYTLVSVIQIPFQGGGDASIPLTPVLAETLSAPVTSQMCRNGETFYIKTDAVALLSGEISERAKNFFRPTSPWVLQKVSVDDAVWGADRAAIEYLLQKRPPEMLKNFSRRRRRLRTP